MKIQSIETSRLILYVSSSKIVQKVYEFIVENKEFLKQWEPARKPHYYTLKHQLQELKKDEKTIKAGTDIRFWMAEKVQPDNIIGCISLNGITMGAFCSAFVGYKMGCNFTNKGYMTEGLSSVCYFAFNGIGLHRVEANIMPRNGPSLAVVKKLGFHEEGLAKKYLQINDVWEDHMHMALLSEE